MRSVRWSDEGVELDAGVPRARARTAIVAIPPNLTGSIHFEPALPGWRMRLQQLDSQGFVMKFLAVTTRRSGVRTASRARGLRPTFVRELYDNSPPSASVGVLCTFLPARPPRRRLV